MANTEGRDVVACKRVSVHELHRTPSHLYQRLLRGEINAWEYVRVLKRTVDMRLARLYDGSSGESG